MEQGAVVAGRFEVVELAGVGGMGQVYRALDRATGAAVALKVLHGMHVGRESERFDREARLLAELDHPGIVRYVAHGASGQGDAWLAMEWLAGVDLATRLGAGALPMADSLTLATRVAEALSRAHAVGVVHRDLKPSNLLLPGGRVDEVKVLDFGVAWRNQAARAVTRTGQLVGTPGYMAPEQARGGREITPAADVFSLGAVLFECLTGRAAFAGEHVMALLAKILLEDAPRVEELAPAVPSELGDLIARMLAKDPAQRPSDARAVVDALARLGAARDSTTESRAATAPGITTTERRILSVVLAADIAPAVTLDPGDIDAPTLATEHVPSSLATLDAAVAAHHGRLELLANGSGVVTLLGTGAATDQAARAARCALALRAHLPDAPLALATGHGVVAGRWPVGEVIDRAAAMLRRAPPAGEGPVLVSVDAVTAGLLGAGFALDAAGDALWLRGERTAVDEARTLLGKASPCVGRERELGVLAGLWQECVHEPVARGALVLGVAGAGKSRLRQEFTTRLRATAAPPTILVAQGEAMMVSSPFAMIAQAIRREAGLVDVASHDERRDRLRARVARHVPAEDRERVAGFLGELCGAPFPDGDNDALRAARRDPTTMSAELRRAFVDWLRHECGARPVLLALEDLHWADQSTVKLVDGALRDLAALPLLVLATARPEVHDLFPRLWTERGVQELRVGPLTRKAAERLVRHALGPDAAASTVDGVVERAQGHPFFVEELVRAVAEGQGAVADALPGSVLAVVQARLEALPPAERRVLRAASVFGPRFSDGGARALLGDGASEQQVSSWLSSLAERELVVRRGAGAGDEGEWTFQHALVREAAYAMLTDADRALGHRLAGAWLEAHGATDASLLAEHAERAGEPERAVALYVTAAERSLATDAAATVRLAERGVACGAAGEPRGDLRRLEARAHIFLHDAAAAEQCAAEAMSLLPPGGRGWSMAAGTLIFCAGVLGHPERFADVVRGLATSGWDASPDAPQVMLVALVILSLLLGGANAPALGLWVQLEAAAPEAERRGLLGRAWIRYVDGLRAYFVTHDRERFYEAMAEAVPLFEEAGDVNGTLSVGALLNARLALDDVAGAEADLAARARVLATVAAPNRVVAIYRALLDARAGRHERALADVREVTEAFAQSSDAFFAAIGRDVTARVLLGMGRRAEAAVAAGEACRAYQRFPAYLPHALGTWARALAPADPTTALAHVRRARELVARGIGTIEAEAVIDLAEAEALEAAGDPAATRAAVSEATARLESRVARVRDPAHRARYAAMPDHVALRELAARVGC